MDTKTNNKLSVLHLLRRNWPFLFALVLLCAGVPGLVERLVEGKKSTNLTSYVPWGLWVSVYVFLVWLEVGSLLVFSALQHFFGWKQLKAISTSVHVAALAILLVALLLIGLDLGKMWRAWRILTEPDFHSPMAWMAWLHVIYTVLIALKLATARRDYPRISRILFWISMPVGVALVSTVGGIFGFNASRPFWNATILPLHFLIASLVAGAALVAAQVLLFTRRFPEGEADKTLVAFRPILLGLIVVGAYSALINALIILIPESPRNAEVLRLVLFGPYWWSFWLLHGGVGVLAPLLILLVGRGKLAVATAAFLVVAGFSALPPNIIIPALAVEPLLGLVRAYTDVRLHLDYYPSQAEWLVLLFITGAGWLIFLVGSRLVDCRRQES